MLEKIPFIENHLIGWWDGENGIVFCRHRKVALRIDMPTIATLFGEPTNDPILLNNKRLLTDYETKLPRRLAHQGFASEITVTNKSLFTHTSNQKQISTPFVCFNLEIETDNILLEHLAKLFSQLPHSEIKNKDFLNIRLEKSNSGWAIIVNGNITVIDNLKSHETAPFILDLAMMTYYRQANFKIAFHGSAIQFKGHNLYFLAPSGSGKSTIFAYFNQIGAIPFSDEALVLDSDFYPIPMPFPMTLKKGSWPLFPNYDHNQSIWQRPYGPALKYFFPKWKPPSKACPACMIFSQYSTSQPEYIQAIGPCKALQNIGLGGYELAEQESEETIENLLNWLDTIPIFEMSYQDFNNAEQMIMSQLK